MDVEKEKEKIKKFIEAGLAVLSSILLIGCVYLYFPKAIATLKKDKNVKVLPIQSVECEEKKIALSFDVSGSAEEVNGILELLKKHQVKATFFLTGEWIDEHPEMVNQIFKDGHDVGNHSENHKEMTELTREDCEQEILKVHKKVRELTGIDMNLFRAPYDDFNHTLLQVTTNLGYYPIEWNIDSHDWKDYGIDPIVNEICNSEELMEGSIVLCHTDTKFTKKALNKVIATLQKRGYSFVKVSNLIMKSNYYIDKTGRQRKNETKNFASVSNHGIISR